MTFLNSYQRARLLLLSASILFFCIFWWTSVLFHIPATPGREASLLQQPSPATAILVLAVVLVACAALGSVIGGIIRFNAGLATAALGLMAITFRGGSSRYSIFHSIESTHSPKPYLTLAFELIILGLIVGGIYYLLTLLQRAGRLRDRDLADPIGHKGDDWPAFGIQTAVTALAILILAPTDAKQQVLAAVGIASFVGAAAAQNTVPTTPRIWFWAPPILVGLAGYVLAWLFPPDHLAIADPQGWTAPLARPLPLDYASVGVAGAIVGHWIGRRWRRERETAPAAALAHGA